jgi:hypothetical protein
MKKFSLAVTVGGALAMAAPAIADEVKKTETTKEQRTGQDSKAEKSETKTTRDPGAAMNSTTDTSTVEKETKRKADGTIEDKSEKTQKHNPPGLKKPSKSTEKERTIKDSSGNVLEHEKKTEK